MKKQREQHIRRVKVGSLPTPVEMRKAAELWLDFYSTAFDAILNDSSASERAKAPAEATILADASLVEFETRWPGVKLRDA